MTRSSKIAVKWFKHLKGNDQKDFEVTLRNSTLVLGRLREILQEDLRGLEKVEMSESSYENPSWAYNQAHINGRKAELTKLLQLTDSIGDSR